MNCLNTHIGIGSGNGNGMGRTFFLDLSKYNNEMSGPNFFNAFLIFKVFKSAFVGLMCSIINIISSTTIVMMNIA
jgi:hypothetical protein